MATKHQHYNQPQIRSMLVGAPVEYAVMGRGTGKTEGILAKKTEKYLHSMPRGTGVCLGSTFKQILTRTLPGLIYGWEKAGYIMNRHYVIGRRPPAQWLKKWNWRGPFRPPLDYEYFISWWNGGGIHMVSQDRTGTSNGITIDWIFGDEAKLLNHEKLTKELLPANRGIVQDFKENPLHHGMTFTTDMPVGTSGRWILDMEKQMDKKRVSEILKLQRLRYNLVQLGRGKTGKMLHEELAKQLDIIDDEVRLLRMGDKTKSEAKLLYYHEASALENIHALGFEYIKEQLRDTSIFEFDTQIMNKRPLRLEDGFYPDLVEEVHGYFAYDYSFIDKIGYNFERLKLDDCRQDADLNLDAPLHMAHDSNRSIHPMAIAQVTEQEIRTIKGMHVLYPLKLNNVLKDFVEYYRFHRNKKIYYWYDHTMVGEQRNDRICDETTAYLDKAGWTVVQCYIGKASPHEARYRMWGHLLKRTGKYKHTFRYNRDNCEHLALSMFQTQAERRKDGFGKDKSTERDPKFPQDQAPHYSEAEDMLVYGVLESGIDYQSMTQGMGFMTM